jgi:hypothetical protein
MTKVKATMTRTEFAALLETYGAERSRWPHDQRAAAAALLSSDREAERLLAEAVALDRVLDRAPRFDAGREAALADRIAALASKAPRVAASNARMATAPAQNTYRLAIPRRDAWRAAGMLAACLVLGFSIGWSGLAQSFGPAVDDIMSNVRVETADTGDHWDEDTL